MDNIFVCIFLCALLGSVRSAEASGMEFGDGLALILGLFIGTVGILACIGKYARKLSGSGSPN